MPINSTPSLRELLDEGAEKYGNSTFISFRENGSIISKSFVRLRDDSISVCRMLRERTETKSNIALIGKTSYDFLVFFSGVIISGNTGVPFSTEISVKEAAALFERADITGLIYDNEFEEKAEIIKSLCPSVTFFQKINDTSITDKIYRKYSDDRLYSKYSDFKVNKDDCAVIIYTSGTTGVKKGVMLSSNALIGNIMYNDYCPDIFNRDDVTLSVLPMYHCYCFSGDFIKNLKDGVRLCLNGSLKDLITNLSVFEPKTIRAVPLIAQSMLQRIKMVQRKFPTISPREAAEKVYGRNIKWIISGGAYLSPDLAEEYNKYGIKLRQGYGMTEAGCRISVPDSEVSLKSVGRVIDICEVRIQNDEIQVKTPTVMSGYYKMPAETQEMFTSDGWLKTGDIGYVTDDNQLFITGRVKNLIILSGGENVSPEAIENKFSSIGLINEIMVFCENNQLVAEIYPDTDYAERNNISDIFSALEDIVCEMNSKAKTSHIISRIKLRNVPFEKTGSGKIIRKQNTI